MAALSGLKVKLDHMKRQYVIGTSYSLASVLGEFEMLGTEIQKCHHKFYGFCWNTYDLPEQLTPQSREDKKGSNNKILELPETFLKYFSCDM